MKSMVSTITDMIPCNIRDGARASLMLHGEGVSELWIAY
jgi:hypothetical protein